MDYTIYAGLAEEINEGWVWLHHPVLATRTPIEMYNPANGRAVLTESRRIEPNFLKRYNKPPRISIKAPDKALVISEWYGHALGDIQTTRQSGRDVPLVITPLKKPGWRAIRVSCHHPDIVARVGTRLGVLGAWLGLLGITAPVLDYLDLGRCTKLAAFIVIAGLGALVGWLASRGPSA